MREENTTLSGTKETPTVHLLCYISEYKIVLLKLWNVIITSSKFILIFYLLMVNSQIAWSFTNSRLFNKMHYGKTQKVLSSNMQRASVIELSCSCHVFIQLPCFHTAAMFSCSCHVFIQLPYFHKAFWLWQIHITSATFGLKILKESSQYWDSL